MIPFEESLRVLVMRYLLFTLLLVASVLSAADFFPLAVGNHWTLRSASGARQEIRVGYNLWSKDNETYYRVAGYRAEDTWLRRDDQGDLRWVDLETEKVELLTQFDAQASEYSIRLGACPQFARVDEKRDEWNRLPALRIRYEGGCPDNAITKELYLENLGLVRRVVSTFIGQVTYDLVEAKVGNFNYSQQTGAFFDMSLPSATLVAESGEAATMVTLRLASRNSEPIRLRYSSGQQFEFKLFNQAGGLVWQWSTDRVFIAGLSDETVLDRTWEKKILLEGVQPGIYVLEGSLTNSGPYRFASSMTLRIN